MSRLYVSKLYSVLKNTKSSEGLLSQLQCKIDDRFNDAVCRNCLRSYTQYSSQLTSRIYPMYNKCLDRIFAKYSLTLSTAVTEKHRKCDGRPRRRHYKYLGFLLSGLGFVVALCDAQNFKGIYIYFFN